MLSWRDSITTVVISDVMCHCQFPGVICRQTAGLKFHKVTAWNVVGYKYSDLFIANFSRVC